MDRSLIDDARINRIEWAWLEATRPRAAGSNARLGAHGSTIRVPMAKITDSNGATGFGASHISQEQASRLVRQPLNEAFRPGIESDLITNAFASLEYPLYDLMGNRARKPVYALLNPHTPGGPLTVPCYDTSLYFDDLHLDSNEEAAELIADEALFGLANGHRSFKIKVGRGGRHMPLEKGTERDIAVIRAVRDAIGPNGSLMIDANNGYNLNLTKYVLEKTADCRLTWIEEPFHEDIVLYRDLKAWMAARGLSVLISDGEGEASPSLTRWAIEDGVVDILQYDAFHPGFSFWIELGQKIAQTTTVCAAPHHYGRMLGNFVTGHLATRVPRLLFVEWDGATTPAIDTSLYRVADGCVVLPDAPGFGLGLDEDLWAAAVRENGFAVGNV